MLYIQWAAAIVTAPRNFLLKCIDRLAWYWLSKREIEPCIYKLESITLIKIVLLRCLFSRPTWTSVAWWLSPFSHSYSSVVFFNINLKQNFFIEVSNNFLLTSVCLFAICKCLFLFILSISISFSHVSVELIAQGFVNNDLPLVCTVNLLVCAVGWISESHAGSGASRVSLDSVCSDECMIILLFTNTKASTIRNIAVNIFVLFYFFIFIFFFFSFSTLIDA